MKKLNITIVVLTLILFLATIYVSYDAAFSQNYAKAIHIIFTSVLTVLIGIYFEVMKK